jgi:hypothetical protein
MIKKMKPWVALYHRNAPLPSIYLDRFGFIAQRERKIEIIPLLLPYACSDKRYNMQICSDNQIKDVDSSACNFAL